MFVGKEWNQTGSWFHTKMVCERRISSWPQEGAIVPVTTGYSCFKPETDNSGVGPHAISSRVGPGMTSSMQRDCALSTARHPRAKTRGLFTCKTLTKVKYPRVEPEGDDPVCVGLCPSPSTMSLPGSRPARGRLPSQHPSRDPATAARWFDRSPNQPQISGWIPGRARDDIECGPEPCPTLPSADEWHHAATPTAPPSPSRGGQGWGDESHDASTGKQTNTPHPNSAAISAKNPSGPSISFSRFPSITRNRLPSPRTKLLSCDTRTQVAP